MEISFKRYLVEMSKECTIMMSNMEKKERTLKQP